MTVAREDREPVAHEAGAPQRAGADRAEIESTGLAPIELQPTELEPTELGRTGTDSNAGPVEGAAAAVRDPDARTADGDDAAGDATVPDPLWYKDAIIYQMHVKAFCDANGDGIGDFAGLVQKLDYIQELGVNTIWLLPFYPSPQRDDGYDIADYRDVHPDYGTLDDFRLFIDEAHRRGLKVITELVINHTSDQHPWFQAARRAPPGSPEHEFYVWSDTDKKFAGTRIIFTDTETSNWAWDPLARRYYWHRFFSHQPDLNHNNPKVVDAVIDVMRFWLDLGVDGMRLDAIPYLCVAEGTNNENLPETHAVLKRMRAVVDANYTGRMFLAEANQWPEDVSEYFGDGDECHVAYHFPLMPRIFMAVALEDRYPIAEILRQTPDIPDNCQWAIFLRNHDELTLEMVTDRERDYMYKMYAREPRMRVNVGIRRRLAPLLSNDGDRIKLMNSLLLSMPGSPVIYYGDEIGMGDNIYIGDRNGVRTPMQWSIDRNAGFSRADPQRLYLPLVMDPVYGYQAVNVEAQDREPASLLNWTRRLMAVRRQHRCFGRGTLEFVRPHNRKIMAYVRSLGSETVLCVANLSQTAQAVELDLSRYRGKVPVELTGRNAFPPIGELDYFVTLPAHGFFWFLLSDSTPPPAWHVERLPAKELPVLVLMDGISSLRSTDAPLLSRSVVRRTLQQLEDEVLVEFLHMRGWLHAGVDAKVRLGERIVWSGSHGDALLAFVYVEDGAGESQRYAVPLTLAWDDGVDGEVLKTAHWTLATVRQHSRVGVLLDAFADPAFCASIVHGVDTSQEIAFTDGALRFEHTANWDQVSLAKLRPVQHFTSEPFETSMALGESVFLKVYRRAEAGINPDIEMTHFLTQARFARIPSLGGTVTCELKGSEPIVLAALFAYVGNQGDAWTYTLDHLDRFLTSTPGEAESQNGKSPHELFDTRIQALGRCLGELHVALLSDSDDAAFAPEPLESTDLRRHAAAIETALDAICSTVVERAASLARALPGAKRLTAQAKRLREAREQLVARVQTLIAPALASAAPVVKARYHGDLQLRKVLLVEDDFLVFDFDGDVWLPMHERRHKDSPLRDVAGMLYSLDKARASALERALAAHPDRRERFEAALAAWLEEAGEAFLKGYWQGAGTAAGLPANQQVARNLIDLFQMERIVRDLRARLDRQLNEAGPLMEALLRFVPGGGRSTRRGRRSRSDN